MVQSRKWIVHEMQRELVERLSGALRVPIPVAQVLVNRGVKETRHAERFLSPALRALHAPEGLADMDRAAQRVLAAVDAGQRILVYGDFDVDGVTATALLLSFLRGVGADVTAVIPNRQREGYGLHRRLLENARDGGIDLVITVDCGATDTDSILAAREMGMDVIVTDHHELPDSLPPAHSVVNPKRADNRYPFAELAGVGVAFLLVWALARRLKQRGFWRAGEEPSLKTYLDLVALGTVADQAPLLGENRTLVKYGLQRMNRRPSPWVSALMNASGLGKRPVSVGTIAFQMAPRLNAPGRIDEAHHALELLMTRREDRALELASLLDGMNRRRQQVEESVFQEARALAEEELSKGRRAIVLAREGWHPGVVGIVASRLVEQYGAPVVLVAIQDGIGKGSARSPEGFHLIRHIRACADLLERFGGHRQAAGLRIHPRSVEAFREIFCGLANSALADLAPGPTLRIDGPLRPEQVTPELLRDLQKLEPHGVGNPEPVFLMDRMEIASCRLVGQDHLKLWVREGTLGFDAIGFGLGSAFQGEAGGLARLACIPQFNEWEGRTSIQLKLKDIQLL